MKEKTEKPNEGLDQELLDHQDEITELNQKYKKALAQKASVYEELIECLKELMSRGSSYIEKHYKKIQTDANQKIIKLQLEQKEKRECDLKAKHQELFQMNPQILDLIEENTKKMARDVEVRYRSQVKQEEAQVDLMEKVALQKDILR